MAETDRPVRSWPVFVGVLGGFVLLKSGYAVALRPGGKVEMLLAELAVRADGGAPREELLTTIWPGSDPPLASHSLNELVSSLHRQFSDVLAGDGPVIRAGGRYLLNMSAGVGLDIAAFEAAADAGDASLRSGDVDAGRRAYAEALALYRGDLCIASDVRHIVDRERLRMRYLGLQSALADSLFVERDYRGALERSLDLLSHDPCREDAHRLVIRCHMRLGERSQALRQYQLCRTILRTEFEAEPEAATTALYHKVRLDPASI
ncbi:MAG: bacterial transcriptional activator domain-containing protein [Chloroflexi bacterium]|nr:bacterial transcriptional activator domain-containing protein [Chloroflexota bacterium]